MSGYKNFAIAGSGRIGALIVAELLKLKSNGKVDKVIVLTRSAEGAESIKPSGAEPIIVDYTSPSSLQSALKGIDVLISTLSPMALSAQEPLFDAAHASAVSLVVPSEFGADSNTITQGLFAVKNAQRAYLDKLGVPWAAYFTGTFADWVWYQPWLGYDLENGRVEMVGTGNGVVGWTSRKDVARYVAWSLTSLPASELARHVFKLEGERLSTNGVLDAYEQKTGKKVERVYLPMEQAYGLIQSGDPAMAFKGFLMVLHETQGTNGGREEMNVEWKEFHPQGVVEAILDPEGH